MSNFRRMRLASLLWVLPLAASTVACSSGTTTTSNLGPEPSLDAGADVAPGDAEPPPANDAGTHAAPPRTARLMLGGVEVALDEASAVGFTTNDFNGQYLITTITVKLVKPEQFVWNPDHLPAILVIHDEYRRRDGEVQPVGDLECLRVPKDGSSYAFTEFSIFTDVPGGGKLLLRAGDAPCSMHLEQWTGAYRGSAQGSVTVEEGSSAALPYHSTLSFTTSWSLRKCQALDGIPRVQSCVP